MFSFSYPYLLFLLLLIPLLVYYTTKYRKRPSLLVASSDSFDFGKNGSGWYKKVTIPDIFYLSALALLLFALAQPRWGDDKFLYRADGIDIVLALDLSGSMAIVDVPEGINRSSEIISGVKNGDIKTRLDVAKEALKKFVSERPNDRFALIGFAEAAYRFAPPTLDHSLIVTLLDSLRPGILRSGATGIASPIISGIKLLSTSSAPRRVLVLFTDGSNNVDHAATPLGAAELAKAKDVTIYTVGIGSGRGFQVVNGFGGASVQHIADSFDEPLLREIAKITGGRYFQASDSDGMVRVMEDINKLEKTSSEQPMITDYRHYAPMVSLIALGLLLVGFGLECTVKLRLP